MKNNLLWLFVALLFVGCAKEQELDFAATEKIEQTPADPIAQAKVGPPPCPAPEDLPCDKLDLFAPTMFGEFVPGQPSRRVGVIDQLLQCPYVPIEACERACDQITINWEGFSWVRVYNLNDPEIPCSKDGIFSAAEQQAIIDDIRAYAAANAPNCPGTNRKMSVLKYDTYYLLGFSGVINVGVSITYIAPCVGGPYQL